MVSSQDRGRSQFPQDICSGLQALGEICWRQNSPARGMKSSFQTGPGSKARHFSGANFVPGIIHMDVLQGMMWSSPGRQRGKDKMTHLSPGSSLDHPKDGTGRWAKFRTAEMEFPEGWKGKSRGLRGCSKSCGYSPGQGDRGDVAMVWSRPELLPLIQNTMR